MEKQSRVVSPWCESLCRARMHGSGSPLSEDTPAHQMRLLLFLGGWLLSAVLPTTSPHKVPALLWETLSPLSAPLPLQCWTSSRGGHGNEMGDPHPPQHADKGEPGEPGFGAAHDLCFSPSFLLPEDLLDTAEGPRSSHNSILTGCSPVPLKCCTCCSWGNYS